MVVGNGENLKIRGWCCLRFAVVDKVVYHEVGVVEKLPCDFMVGAEFMAPHEDQLTYVGEGRTAMRIRQPWCKHCEENKEVLKLDPQMKYSVKPAKLLKRDSHGDRYFPSCMLVVGKQQQFVPALKRVPRHIMTQPIDITNRMDKLILELKVPEMQIPDDIRNKLLPLLRTHINVFQLDENDLGFTNIVQHSIRLIPGTEPVRQKFRPIPFSRLEVIEKYIITCLKQ